MIFSSIEFLFRFLPVFLICYFLTPGKMKNFVLLVGSLVFYAWGEPTYCILLLFSIGWDYVNGLLIEKYHRHRTVFLMLSIVLNLGILCFYRYVDIIIMAINSVAKTNLPCLQPGFPMALPFYTLQTLSYIISVYRGEAKACKNPIDYATYVSMFPQLMNGPVVDYTKITDQLTDRKVTPEGISSGLKRFCFGLGKKVLLANELGQLWNEVSGAEFGQISAATAWLGIIAFGLQIYFEFSGFADMAIGLGQILGFTLPENFNYPYLSASVTEFFDRWFISLTDWVKKYLYRPLSGHCDNISVRAFVMLFLGILMGAWYGTDWSFLVWGLWMAFLYLLEHLFLEEVLSGLVRPVGIIYTCIAVLIGWVFFAVKDMQQGLQYLYTLAGLGKMIDRQAIFLGKEYLVLLIVAGACCTPLFSDIAKKLKNSGTGSGIALYRFGEKVIPSVILLLAIAGIVGSSYHPFLFFGL